MTKKQKSKRNKKYKQKYYTGGRLDMRTGGRVSKAHGGSHEEDIIKGGDMPVSIPVGKRPDRPLEERDIAIKDDGLLGTPSNQPVMNLF